VTDRPARSVPISHDPDIYPTAHEGLEGLSRVSRRQLEYLIAKMPGEGGRFLEIGSASGVTAALIAAARPRLTIVCADIFVGAASRACIAEEGDRLLNWRANKRPNMHLWFGTAEDLISILQPEARFDVVLVDAHHDYECTLDCLIEAAALVSAQGVILVHDWGDPNWPEVEQAGIRFCEDYDYEIADSFSSIRDLRKKPVP
jgi:predicted O-methyltransferase YrrM